VLTTQFYFPGQKANLTDEFFHRELVMQVAARDYALRARFDAVVPATMRRSAEAAGCHHLTSVILTSPALRLQRPSGMPYIELRGLRNCCCGSVRRVGCEGPATGD
jgi:hypothetical protein